MDEKANLYEHASATKSATIVGRNAQRENPLLKSLKHVHIEFTNIVPDFLITNNLAVLFISLKYHQRYPEYLKNRISVVEKRYTLCVLICLVEPDVSEDQFLNIQLIAFNSSIKFLPVYTYTSAAMILELLKKNSSMTVEDIQKKLSTDYRERAIDILTTIPSINKSDAHSLMKHFRTFRKLLGGSRRDFENIPGMGPKKVDQLVRALELPIDDFDDFED